MNSNPQIGSVLAAAGGASVLASRLRESSRLKLAGNLAHPRPPGFDMHAINTPEEMGKKW
jgi:hypothetical protein